MKILIQNFLLVPLESLLDGFLIESWHPAAVLVIVHLAEILSNNIYLPMLSTLVWYQNKWMSSSLTSVLFFYPLFDPIKHLHLYTKY